VVLSEFIHDRLVRLESQLDSFIVVELVLFLELGNFALVLGQFLPKELKVVLSRLYFSFKDHRGVAFRRDKDVGVDSLDCVCPFFGKNDFESFLFSNPFVENGQRDFRLSVGNAACVVVFEESALFLGLNFLDLLYYCDQLF
jgi:hypothetical protein